MSRILVFMSDNRNLENLLIKANYNSLVASINYEYCKLHNYDFLYYRPYLINKDKINLLNCKNPITNNFRHSAWSKLLSTSLALKLNYDYVCYIDSDCIFKDFNQSLENFIKSYSDKDILFLNNKPWGDNMPCSGFYICKVNNNSQQFLQDWYNFNIPEKDTNHAWEQDALWKIFKNYNIEIIDSWMFHEKPDQFLRHVSSCENNNRMPYFSSFIKKKNINYIKNINEINIIEFNTNNNNSIINNSSIINNKKYSWENNSITFLENGEMNAFGKGVYIQQDTYKFQANFGGRIHFLLFNNDYTEFISTRKDDNNIVKGKLLN